MARPYWSGQITISLVSFAVEIYPASTAAREFHFHQIDRATGHRIHHQDIASNSGDDLSDDRDTHSVAKSGVVKGYEYKKGKYAIIEPEELKRLRIPGKKTVEITQFASAGEIHPSLYEKPYFVVPKEGPQAQAFAIVRKAMMESDVVAIGQIVFSGREHLAALAPSPDPKQPGMMLYTLRFAEELRDADAYFGKIKQQKSDSAQLSLAKQLIHAYTQPFELDKFKDSYEAAVRKLVEAKLKHKTLPEEEPERPRAKVIDLMDALKRSLNAPKPPVHHRKTKPAHKPSRLKLVAKTG